MTDQEREQIRQKNLLWALAVETSVQSREDPVLIFERLLFKYENKEAVTTGISTVS